VGRPRRYVAAGAHYHVGAKGNNGAPIVLDREDRAVFFHILRRVERRYGWRLHVKCLMGNHYHLVLETPEADISAGMQWLNGRYAQDFNHRHAVDGHLFQGRFYSGQVEGDWHLLELTRYLARNPVDAGLCRHPRGWPWGSYRAVAGFERPLAMRFLDVRRVLDLFGKRHDSARKRFRTFVDDAPNRPRA